MFLRAATLVLAMLCCTAPANADGQRGFVDRFDAGPPTLDPAARRGWATITGDCEATMTLTQRDGHGVVSVDATADRRGIWWAIIKRSISSAIDARALARPDRELRVEARVRSLRAPRRLNLSVNHTRATDFHDNLAEFDLPDTGWRTLGFTTRGFDATPADEVFVQLALIDWGIDRFAVEVDYLKVDVVDPRRAQPDRGEPLPYRPAIPPASAFAHAVAVAQDAIVDSAYPWVNFRTWASQSGAARSPLLAVSPSQTILLRFDLSAFRGREPNGWGVLSLTTDAVQWAPTDLEEFGYLRVSEILEGDPAWTRATVTQDSFLAGRPRGEAIGQMMIDVPPSFAAGSRTLISVSPPVLRRLLSGQSKGLAITAQGAVAGSFRSSEAADPAERPVLRFNLR